MIHPPQVERWSRPITTYVSCYDSGSITASGSPVYLGEVAMKEGTEPFGTRIRFTKSVFGHRDFKVMDRMASSDLATIDVYYPSYDSCTVFGIERLTYSVAL